MVKDLYTHAKKMTGRKSQGRGQTRLFPTKVPCKYFRGKMLLSPLPVQFLVLTVVYTIW